MKNRARLAILIGPKGRGSNMRALAEACASGELDADVAAVVSPKDGTPAVEWARDRGLRVEIIPSNAGNSEELLLAALESSGATHVALAGYLRLLPQSVLKRFPGRVLNIHPALLPEFGGKGMYGERVHEAVLDSGAKESGCTVHLVGASYDEGPILLQLRCKVLSNDTPNTLAERVLHLEHQAYKQALKELLASADEVMK